MRVRSTSVLSPLPPEEAGGAAEPEDLPAAAPPLVPAAPVPDPAAGLKVPFPSLPGEAARSSMWITLGSGAGLACLAFSRRSSSRLAASPSESARAVGPAVRATARQYRIPI